MDKWENRHEAKTHTGKCTITAVVGAAKDWFSISRELWPVWDIKRDVLENFNTCSKT